MYTVVIHRRSAHYMQRLPQDQKVKIKNILNEISNDPFGLPGIKNMVGNWAGYQRIRIGNTRIIFWINKIEQIIYVDYIGARGNIYKK